MATSRNVNTVNMTHPEIPDHTASATETAFERVWEPLGWQLESAAAPPPAPKAEPKAQPKPAPSV